MLDLHFFYLLHLLFIQNGSPTGHRQIIIIGTFSLFCIIALCHKMVFYLHCNISSLYLSVAYQLKCGFFSGIVLGLCWLWALLLHLWQGLSFLSWLDWQPLLLAWWLVSWPVGFPFFLLSVWIHLIETTLIECVLLGLHKSSFESALVILPCFESFSYFWHHLMLLHWRKITLLLLSTLFIAFILAWVYIIIFRLSAV